MWGFHAAHQSAQRAFVAKDVTADILPPPLYLIEMRLVLSQAVEGSMPAAKAETELARLEKEYLERVEYWTKNPPYGLESQLLGGQHTAGQRFIAAAKAVLAAVKRGDSGEAQSALQAAHAQYTEHRAGVDETVKASNAFAESAIASLESSKSMASWAQWIVLAVSTTLLLLAGVWVRKRFWAATGGEPVEVATIANLVAKGDLSVRVDLRPGDTSSVMASMARMCESLKRLVGQVRSSSETIASASSELAQGNQDLSQRTVEQASAIEQTAASIRELSAAVQENSQNAHRATNLAEGASSVARKGGQVVSEVVGTMNNIRESSKSIADIISVIDGIAFQTNILALNAAVEAARAGEQGRGFAVVASEVRVLAQRSAAAAKEIKELILRSVTEVESGTQLVSHAGETMNQIVTANTDVMKIIAEISAAGKEQASRIDQVSRAIAEVDNMTQQNAALVEEAAAAAESLRQQSGDLSRVIAAFTVAPDARGDDVVLSGSTTPELPRVVQGSVDATSRSESLSRAA
jgi:methyl-accepting chemotaxis protein